MAIECLDYIWHNKSYNKCDLPPNCTKTNLCILPLDCPRKTTCEEGIPCQTLIVSKKDGGYIWQVSGCALQEKCQISHSSSSCVFQHSTSNAYQCCCNEPMCNRNLVFNDSHMKPRTTVATTISYPNFKPHDYGRSSSKILYYVLPPLFIIFISVLVLICIWKRHKKLSSDGHPLLMSSVPSTPPIDVKPINKIEVISRGQFGCVWKAQYEGIIVAAKIIPAHEKSSWETEKLMYSEHRLKHENILNFIAAQHRCEDGVVSYSIITEFHENGSLADFLHVHILDFETLMKLSTSMIAGLAYLHAFQNVNNSQKPVISHRDFKSRNVLVKLNLTCCISDFGSACAFYHGVDNEDSRAQVGTKRYMAPEVLQGAIAFHAEAFLSIDVYALALVMWELLTRCNVTGVPSEPYKAPYEEEVGIHPSIEEMRNCVLDNKTRPHLKEEWRRHKELREFCDTIEDCWDEDGDARLTAHCVYERLIKLSTAGSYDESDDISKDSTIHMNGDLRVDLSDDTKPEYSFSSIASSRRTEDTTC